MSHKSDKFHGLLLLAKPVGISSHDAVDRVRRIIGQRSVGHAGTLDPNAEGLLVMLLGQATKIAQYLTMQDKEYEAEVTLGRASATYDAEGIDASVDSQPVPKLDATMLEDLLSHFRGTITQKVPPYSAVQVDGERLYRLARRGEAVETPEREVTIESLDLVDFEQTQFRMKLTCSKGTYVRSLAHDMGQRLGCGGYLSQLRRTRSGSFLLSDALTFESLEQKMQAGKLSDALQSIGQALDFGSMTVNEQFRAQVQFGRRPRAADIARVEGDFGLGENILLKDQGGAVLAIGTAAMAAAAMNHESEIEVIKYSRVFA